MQEDGLIPVTKTHTMLVDGRAVIIHDVPMLQDPDTEELFLAPDTAEQLYELVRHPEQKQSVTSADVYRWTTPENVGA